MSFILLSIIAVMRISIYNLLLIYSNIFFISNTFLFRRHIIIRYVRTPLRMFYYEFPFFLAVSNLSFRWKYMNYILNFLNNCNDIKLHKKCLLDVINDIFNIILYLVKWEVNQIYCVLTCVWENWDNYYWTLVAVFWSSS